MMIRSAITKTLLLILALGAIVCTAQAKDKEIDGLLQRAASQLFPKNKAVEVSYGGSSWDADGSLIMNFTGSIILQGEMFRLVTEDVLVVYDGKQAATYDKEEETLTYSKLSGEEVMQLNPLAFVRGYEKLFRVEPAAPSKGEEAANFFPKDRKSNIKQMTLYFDRARGQVSRAVVLGQDGTRLSLKFGTPMPSQPLEKSAFRLKRNQYPKAEVITLE